MIVNFATSNNDTNGNGLNLLHEKPKIHIRIQPRNGKKNITSIQGLDSDLHLERILKALKKSFQCNGTIADDPKMGNVIQLSGDHRVNARAFLIDQSIATDEEIVVH